MTALDALAELHALLQHLPEPHRGRADELLAGLIADETARTDAKSERMQRLLESRLIPPEQRAHELAAVVEYTLHTPRLSDSARRRRMAERGLSESRARDYQALLAHFRLVPLPEPPPPDPATETLRLQTVAAKAVRSNWGRYTAKSGRAIAPSYDD